MIFAVNVLADFLRGIGFRKITVNEYIGTPGLATVTISGLGRFRRLTGPELWAIKAGKPLWLEIKLERKFLGFKLWEAKLGGVSITYSVTEVSKGVKP